MVKAINVVALLALLAPLGESQVIDVSESAAQHEHWDHSAGGRIGYGGKRPKAKSGEPSGYETKAAYNKWQALFPAAPAGASPETRKEMCPDPQTPKATKRVLGCSIWDIFGEGTVQADVQTDQYLEWYAQQMKAFKDVAPAGTVTDYETEFKNPPKQDWMKAPEKVVNAGVKESKIKEADLPWEENGLKKGNKELKMPDAPKFKNPFKKEIKETDLPWEVNGLKKQAATTEKLSNLPALPDFGRKKKEIKEADLPWEVNGLKKGNKNITLPELPKKEGEDYAPWTYDPAKGSTPMGLDDYIGKKK